MRRICCCAVLALLLVALPASARSTRSERVVAAKVFAQRTLSFSDQRRSASGQARQALDAQRAAAQGCLAAWNSAPAARHDDVGLIYFEYLSGALWSVDAPLYRSWIGDLRRSKRVDRSPLLARAADALRRAYAVAEIAYRAFPDACATVTRWRDAGWTEAARPAELNAIYTRVVDFARPSGAAALDEAQRQLVRYAGRRGAVAGAIVAGGIDEDDARVHAHSGCDAVGALFFPDDYNGCPPAPAGGGYPAAASTTTGTTTGSSPATVKLWPSLTSVSGAPSSS